MGRSVSALFRGCGLVGVLVAGPIACSPGAIPLLSRGDDASLSDATGDLAADAAPAIDVLDAGTPTADVVDAGTRTMDAVDAGTPTADVVDAGTPTADVADAGTPTADVVDAGTPTADVVDAGGTCATSGDCGPGFSCAALRCVARVCTPGAASCVDRLTRRECGADGLAFTSTACPSDARCQGDGVCQTYRDLVLSSRPVAYWRFEEAAGPTARDEVSGRIATAVGAVEFARAGLVGSGRALRCRGAQYLNVPYAAALNPDAFSVEVWATVAGAEGTFRSLFTSRFNIPTQGYALYVNPGNRWELYVGDGTALEWQPTSGGAAVALDTTYHVVVTFGAHEVRVYVDGAVVASRTGVNLRANAVGGGRIGAGATEYPNGADYFYDGLLDELAVYDRALTADEVAAHRARGTAP